MKLTLIAGSLLAGLVLSGCNAHRAANVDHGQPVIETESPEVLAIEQEIILEMEQDDVEAQVDTDEKFNIAQESNIAKESNISEQSNIAKESNISEQSNIAEEADVTEKEFSALENQLFTASDMRCLSVSAESNAVVLGDCRELETSADASMKLWKIVLNYENYYNILNQHNIDQNAQQCLKTIYASNQVEMGKCDGTSTVKDYNSKRLWKLIKTGEHYQLENKYRSDLGAATRCLSVNANTSSLIVDVCEGEQAPNRLWKFDGKF